VGVEQEFSPALKAHPAFHVRSYDALVERLRAAGIEVADDVSLPGVRRCHLHDPFGNRIELVAQD
jgi:catechol 2,3-dioxygenase-like lactoylglutathione lyase family enzyme